tara:strand:- start:2743 stop:3204 length:462 start_codon:yes stop_codon:yes gene_type:complete
MKKIKLITIYVMGLLYILVGIKHFTDPKLFMCIVPPQLIFKKFIVIISGLVEIILGCMLILKKTRKIAGIGIIILLISIFPANIYLFISETARIDFGKATGKEITELDALIRMPYQIPLMVLAFWHSKENNTNIFSIICIVIFIPTIIYFISL